MAIRLRCKSRCRVIGGIVRCELARNHEGVHQIHLGISPIQWEDE